MIRKRRSHMMETEKRGKVQAGEEEKSKSYTEN